MVVLGAAAPCGRALAVMAVLEMAKMMVNECM